MITGNVIGGVIKNPDTIILVDENGKEYTAVMTGEDVQITATVNDVRLGKTAAFTDGVKTGEKFIPAYHTNEGLRAIPDGSPFTIPTLLEQDAYDFTKLQAIICDFNTSTTDSVAANQISVNGNVYATQSSTIISVVEKKHDTKTIDLGIINNSGNLKILRYFTYKEI